MDLQFITCDAKWNETEKTYLQRVLRETKQDLLVVRHKWTYWGRKGRGQDTEIQCHCTLLAKTATLPKPTR